MKTDALAATQFLKDREEAGLPNPTADQVKRATRLTEQNPTLRGHRTPLGIQLLALKLPTTRFERKAEQARLAREIDAAKADDTKSPEVTERIVAELSARHASLDLKPYRCRGEHLKVEASRAAVEAFVGANPGISPLEAADAIAGMSGYSTAVPAMRRVARYLKRGSARIPGHIREKALMLSAIAQASDAIAVRDAAAAEATA